MLILSNCLTDIVDEGCLKVMNNLAKRVKAADADAVVVTYERKSNLTDLHMHLNKLLLNKDLFDLLRKKAKPVLYLPFPTRSLPTAIRIFCLSWMTSQPVSVVLTMTREHGLLSKILLKASRAHLYVLSKAALEFYLSFLSSDRVSYLKTGVDSTKFVPASPEQISFLKRKYGLDPNRKTVLHVGHMKAGRNIEKLMDVDSIYQVLVVTSTFTKNSEDIQVREKLEKCPNVTIIDWYLPNIEEIYQLADVYVFPVVEKENCIDLPVSCMEAAACGKPVITTTYGEMTSFIGSPGFWFADMEKDDLNLIIASALEGDGARDAVLEYDWANAVQLLRKQ